MEEYLHSLERALRLGREETRAIITEVRGTLEDLSAHLQAQGMERADAEAMALSRFGAASDLAHSLRRAHGRAPLPLRALALVLLAAGTGGLAVLGSMAESLIRIATKPQSDRLLASIAHVPNPFQPGFLIAAWRWLIFTFPLLPIFACAVGSLCLAGAVLRGRRPRWRILGSGLGIMIVLDLFVVLVLSSFLRPLDMSRYPLHAIPNLAQLTSADLVARPDPNQPASPGRVGLVAVDAETTYVAYTVPDPLHAGGAWEPMLFDDRGGQYKLYGGLAWSSGELQQLTPWPSLSYGLARFEALRPGVHAAVVYFRRVPSVDEVVRSVQPLWQLPSSDVSGLEMVRVPLNVRALALAHTARPSHAVTVHGN
jgi:hypothetical protein